MNTSRNIFHKSSKTAFLFFVFVLVVFGWLTMVNQRAQALGVLDVTLYAPNGDPLNAYNLVVDSNVTATSTEAPNVATVAVRFCNTGDMELTNVWGYIGDFDASPTPGIYPAKVDADFDSLPGGNSFSNGGSYSFTHMGAASDASRFIGTIPAGDCSVQYWHFTYPQCENDTGGVADTPPCNNSPTWGDSVNANDDMSLNFDVWGTSDQGGDNETWTMWMRNEISAMANKIQPNPDGRWFNTDTSVVLPGETITTNGVLYEFGNINQGFDNSIDSDGDGIPDPAGQDGLPDYNAWAQPIGAPSYDPSCFQLVKTETELFVSRSGGLPDLTLNFTDQLYFTNLPANNTGVRGIVRYTFLALDGACFSGLSPYQEVASGSDNEKFNGDYGAGIPPIQSTESKVGIDKSSAPSTIPEGNITQYTIPFWNDGDKDAGLFLSSGNVLNLPLLIQDVVPDGMQYVCGSAQFNTPDVPEGVTIYYSDVNGANWSTVETSIGCPTNPTSTAGGSEIVIQWWLNGPLPANRPVANNNYAQFQAFVPAGGIGTSFVENCATSHFGPSGPAFDEACDILLIEGTGNIGDFVWRDENWDGLQTGEAGNGIDGVTVSLYWDKNNDDAFDEGDVLISTQETVGGGAYDFTLLPPGEYVVVVDVDDAPAGYRPTTPVTHAVTLAVGQNYDDADFGFGPILSLNKSLVSGSPAYEGQEVTYTIDLTNNLPGNGKPPGYCTYDVWTGNAATGSNNKAWSNVPGGVLGAPNGSVVTAEYANASEELTLDQFYTTDPGEVIQKVELILANVEVDGLVGEPLSVSLDGTELDLGSGTPTYSDVSLLNNVEVIDVTSQRAPWTFDDFVSGGAGTEPVVFIVGNGGNSDVSEELRLDAVGFRITTTSICGDPANTIDVLPLTDTYDAANFAFVSATPPESSDTPGTINWDNLGPLYGGQTKQVTVVLKAIQPAGDVLPASQPLTVDPSNCADSVGAQIVGSFPVNDVPQSCVPIDLLPGGSIGDFVWNDLSNDGIQDVGEPGFPGVTVNLYQGAALVATTVTDANGLYLFEGLPDGTYSVQVDTTTLPNGGTGAVNTWDRDSGTNPPPNSDSGSIVLNNSDADPNNNDIRDADFGYTIPTMIEGTIWHDWNENGAATPDTGENWLEGITVYILNGTCDAPPTGGGSSDDCVTAITDANGYFIFTTYNDGGGEVPLVGGIYDVLIDMNSVPVGYTDALSAWTQSFDTDDIASANSVSVNVPTGGVGRADYSYYQTGSSIIGDTVYRDWNGDGDQDTGEEGIPNVTVYLYADTDDDGTPDVLVGTTTTEDGSGSNPAGYYEFTGVPAGDYMVVVGNGVPTGHQQTQDPDESGTCVTCDGQSRVRNVDGTSSYLDEDFGYRPSGSGTIGDYVWQDSDGDGVQDDPADEPPIPNITVTLYEDSDGDGIIDPEDAVIATTETDANGNYLFQGLSTNDVDYIVQVDTNDTDLTPAYSYPSTPPTVPVTLTSSAPINLDADFGFTGPARVGDYIWEDLNGDGEQDRWEVGIPSVTVALEAITAFDDADGNGRWDWGEAITTTQPVTTTTTDGSGYYLFDNLAPGNYRVLVPAAGNTGSGEPLENTTNTGDPDAIACDVGCDDMTNFYIGPGQTDLSRDFGYQPTGIIGDYIWEDIDGDGIQDPTEPPLVGVNVYLCTSVTDPCNSGTVATTNSDGYYFFQNVTAGTYDVQVDTSTLPAGTWSATYDRDNGVGSPAGTLDDRVQGINMNASGFVDAVNGDTCTACNLEMDFGYRQSTRVSGTIFYDVGDDGGIYVLGTDQPYFNVPVYLYDNAGNWYATTTTDSNGFYQFFVPAGAPIQDYTIRYDPNTIVLQNLTMNYEPDATDTNYCPTSAVTCDNATDISVVGTTPVANQDFGFFQNQTLDCGDLVQNLAPAGYNTTLNREGACHTFNTGLYLGASIDADNDGQPEALAGRDTGGDDGDGNDDEDGVVATYNNWLPNTTQEVTVDVTLGTSSAGYLVGWFDWDGSGQFDQVNEQVTYGLINSDGPVLWNLDLPGNYVAGQDLFVRIRLYDASSGIPAMISSTGTAANGEVEDYFWQFNSPTAVSLSAFSANSHVVAPVGLIIILGLVLTAGSIIMVRRRKMIA